MEKLKHTLISVIGKLFVPGIVIPAVIKLAGWNGLQFILGIFMVLLYLCWTVIEPMLTGKGANTEDPNQDKGTFELYFAAKAITVIVSLALPTLGYNNMLHFYGGAVLFVSGLVLRYHSIRTLGNFYSHFVTRKTGHQVIDQGPYRIIRHPSYAGMVIAHLGFVVFFFNPLGAAALLMLLIPAIVRRIHVEEEMLRNQVDHYHEYARQRKRMVPFVW